MSVYIGVNDKAKQPLDIYIGVDNKARQVLRAYIGVNDKARLVYPDSDTYITASSLLRNHRYEDESIIYKITFQII